MKTRKKESKGYFSILVKGFFRLLLLIVIIFLSAGRITYCWQGWLYSGSYVLLFLIISIMLINNPDFADLIKERVKPGPGMKWWDKVFWAFYLPIFLAIIITASVDTGRFGWTTHLPVPVYILDGIKNSLGTMF